LALLAHAGQTQPFTVREMLQNEFRGRLEEAARLYEQVIEAYEGLGAGAGSATDQLYLELSYLYRADCHFDLGQYEQAIPCYELAAYRYQDRPAALSAYVQIIQCYQRLGQWERARTALERVRWLLRRMPAEPFGDAPTGMGREQWQEVLAWVEKSGLLEN
jgi:tetratricopeptide (TPR) repeat protein